jgi:hypothetical protein
MLEYQEPKTATDGAGGRKAKAKGQGRKPNGANEPQRAELGRQGNGVRVALLCCQSNPQVVGQG